jgi:hypothetical protein
MPANLCNSIAISAVITTNPVPFSVRGYAASFEGLGLAKLPASNSLLSAVETAEASERIVTRHIGRFSLHRKLELPPF